MGPNADYLTPEQVIGAYNDRQPWETCMTLGTQWSWKPDDRIKSVDEVIRILAGAPAATGTCSSMSGQSRPAASSRARSTCSRASEPG